MGLTRPREAVASSMLAALLSANFSQLKHPRAVNASTTTFGNFDPSWKTTLVELPSFLNGRLLVSRGRRYAVRMVNIGTLLLDTRGKRISKGWKEVGEEAR